MDWEYKSFTYFTKGFTGNVELTEFDSMLNDYARDGWELISCTPLNEFYGRTRRVLVVMRKKKSM